MRIKDSHSEYNSKTNIFEQTNKTGHTNHHSCSIYKSNWTRHRWLKKL